MQAKPAIIEDRKGQRTPVYLAHSTAKPDRIREQLRLPQGRVDWIYLGRQSVQMLTWQQSLGSLGNRIQYSDRLQEIGLAWRLPYLEWTAEQARNHDSLAWWSSRIGERNTMLDSLYHAICYLRIGLEAITANQSSLLVIAESHGVLLALERYLGPIQAIWASPRCCIVQMGEHWRKHADRVWDQYLSSVDIVLKAAYDSRGGLPSLPPRHTGKQRVLLHSCLDDSYFGNDGHPRERYFPGFVSQMENLGCEVITIPWLYNIEKPIREVFSWFRRHGSAYLIPEDYYTQDDYYWAADIIRSQATIISGAQCFQNMNITELVIEAQWRQSCETDLSKYVRYYRLMEKLAEMGFKFDFFVDTFENMVTEKPQVLGIRRWMPGVRTVGYQHYLALFPLMLCFCTTTSETEIAPLPDIIVCNSPLALEQMEACGFPSQKLRLGPSLRYQHLLKQPEFTRSVTKSILVVLPLDQAACIELMIAVVSVSSSLKDCLFLLKPHPMMRLDTLHSIWGDEKLRGNIRVIRHSMNECLAQASMALVTASTSALEVALSGTPVLVYGRETDFDLNPLAWFNNFAPAVRSPEALHDSIIGSLRCSDKDIDLLRQWAVNARRRLVSPVNDQTISAFVA